MMLQGSGGGLGRGKQNRSYNLSASQLQQKDNKPSDGQPPQRVILKKGSLR